MKNQNKFLRYQQKGKLVNIQVNTANKNKILINKNNINPNKVNNNKNRVYIYHKVLSYNKRKIWIATLLVVVSY
jgi:hypothetical protein